MNTFRRAGLLVLTGVALSTLGGCSVLDSMQREHHFKKGESSALILDAEQRVVTQRDIPRSQQFSDRLAPDVIICAEPSPDVANALSSAIAASLKAGLPSPDGSKSFSADVSRSTSESLMQLGSRIATIQLLRDELADLCRSYANGAVTTTTYTLRLSRLDKKMVTLLLSEAAGRPAGAQSVLLGGAASAGTKPVPAPAPAADDAAKPHQTSLDTPANNVSKDVHTVLLNNTPGGTSSGETLQTLQENFLFQDDLTTFLDACISSLDRQLQPLDPAQRDELNKARDKLQEIERNRNVAKSDYSQARTKAERAEGAERVAAEERAAQIDRYLIDNEMDANLARNKFEEILGRVQPVSRFGEYCQTTALGQLLRSNVDRIQARVYMLQEQQRLAETQARTSALRACENLLANPGTDAASRKACTNTLVQYAKESVYADEPHPRPIASR